MPILLLYNVLGRIVEKDVLRFDGHVYKLLTIELTYINNNQLKALRTPHHTNLLQNVENH